MNNSIKSSAPNRPIGIDVGIVGVLHRADIVRQILRQLQVFRLAMERESDQEKAWSHEACEGRHVKGSWLCTIYTNLPEHKKADPRGGIGFF